MPLVHLGSTTYNKIHSMRRYQFINRTRGRAYCFAINCAPCGTLILLYAVIELCSAVCGWYLCTLRGGYSYFLFHNGGNHSFRNKYLTSYLEFISLRQRQKNALQSRNYPKFLSNYTRDFYLHIEILF